MMMTNDDDKIKKVIREYEEYVRQNGFSLSPNRKMVEGIVKSLLEREKNFGARYCPCRRLSGNPEEDRKIIYPCFYHRTEIEKDSRCLCGLFVK